jgi:cobalt-zinc-cadmium efflux system outer membrane protein
MSNRACIRSLVSALVLTACASVPREAGFSDVQANIEQRSGHQIHWNQGTPADEEAAAKVNSLLEGELTATSAVQIALLNNRGLQATYQELGIAQADLVAAGLLRNPIFNAAVGFEEGGGQAELDLSVTEEFLSILLLPLRRRVAAAGFEAAKLRVAGAVLDLAGEVKAAFYTFEGARQLLEMRMTVLAATQASYDLAKRMHDAGNFRDLDLANERALYEQAKLDVAAAELDVVEERERLNALLGLWGSATQWQTAGRLPEVSREPVQLERLESRAIAQSLELGVARADIERIAERLGLARSTRFASEVELGVGAEREEGSWAIGPAVTLPLPLFDQGQPAIARAAAELRRLEELYAAGAVTIRSDVRAVASRLSMLKAREAYYRAVILPLRQQILDETQKQYNAMQVGAFQLLQAKQQEIEAGSEYIETLRNYWLANAALEQLLSGRRPRFGQPHIDRVLTPGLGRGERAHEESRTGEER